MMRQFRLFAACLWVSGLVLPVWAQDYTGSLKIYDKDMGLMCSIDFVNGETHFKDSATCDNDKAGFFGLDEVPSAALVTFYDAPDCAGHDNFIFTIKTIKHPTSTARETTTTQGPVSLKTAAETEINKVVVPGVLLVASEINSNPIDERLSCVKIQRSAAP